jgi:bifunctional enzyme CysN/CysC
VTHQSELIEKDIHAYLAQHERKELLRFLTCGSVDDGKSTLIGRLLLDSKMVYEDQLAAVRKDSVVHGTTQGDIDPALLTDGLKAEREQGITIDVAYRYFSSAKRKFIIADTPGHEQYTRNMATGASTCDLAIILIDARYGVLTQTKRHSFITSLLGIKHVVVAINKMDLVGYSEERFERIKGDYTDFAARMMVDDVHFLPISALKGDNLLELSREMPWYQGSTLMNLLETVHIASDRNLIDFRFPVQLVNRPHLDFRGFCGTVASGIVRVGDEIIALPSRKRSRIRSIVTANGEIEEAFALQAVTLTLHDEIDISRGDMIVSPGNQPHVADHFETMLVWMDEEPLIPGKQYLFKQTHKMTTGCVSTIRYEVDVNSLRRQEAPSLGLNEIGRCTVQLTQPVVFDPYSRNRSTGAFIVIDRLSNRTVGAGMIIDRSLGDGGRDHWGPASVSGLVREDRGSVTLAERKARFGQTPCTVLFTGLSGAGKSTTAYATERQLFSEGRAVAVLDGKNIRTGISKDLGFSVEHRSENLRRGIEVARLMNESGLICLCAFMAPQEEVRQKAKDAVGAERFLVVHLSAPLEICRARDTEGLYGAADRGEVANFPGVSADYEVPQNPDLVLDTGTITPDLCAERVIELLRSRGFLDGR